jgi:hypothetical protein
VVDTISSFPTAGAAADFRDHLAKRGHTLEVEELAELASEVCKGCPDCNNRTDKEVPPAPRTLRALWTADHYGSPAARGVAMLLLEAVLYRHGPSEVLLTLLETRDEGLARPLPFDKDQLEAIRVRFGVEL